MAPASGERDQPRGCFDSLIRSALSLLAWIARASVGKGPGIALSILTRRFRDIPLRLVVYTRGASNQCKVAGAPQHFLNFLPLPHGHGSFRPTLGFDRTFDVETTGAADVSLQGCQYR